MRLYRLWISFLGFSLVPVLIGGNVSSTWAQGAGAAAPGVPHRVAGVVFAQDGLSVDVQDEDFGAIFRTSPRKHRSTSATWMDYLIAEFQHSSPTCLS